MIKLHQEVCDTAELARIRDALTARGFARTNDCDLGLPAELPDLLGKRFYTDDVLGPEAPGVPPHDRIRARDVVEYQRTDAGIALAEFITSALPSNEDVAFDRYFNRPYALEDELMARWIGTVLSMVPIDEREEHGTIGLNYNRTFNDVVGWAHQDASQFTVVYVRERCSKGATTILHPREAGHPDRFDTTKIVCGATLERGEYLIFRDSDFKHNVTPIEPRFPGDNQKHRDTLIGVIQPPSNYNLHQYSFPAYEHAAEVTTTPPETLAVIDG